MWRISLVKSIIDREKTQLFYDLAQTRQVLLHAGLRPEAPSLSSSYEGRVGSWAPCSRNENKENMRLRGTEYEEWRDGAEGRSPANTRKDTSRGWGTKPREVSLRAKRECGGRSRPYWNELWGTNNEWKYGRDLPPPPSPVRRSLAQHHLNTTSFAEEPWRGRGNQ